MNSRYIKESTLFIETTKGIVVMDAEDEHLLDDMAVDIKKGYVRTRSNKTHKRQSLHRIIMQPLSVFVGDHINGNTLDNRKENLRVCTIQENARNNKGHSGRKSPYKGVYFDTHAKGVKKWRAYTRINGKRLWFGYHMTAELAAMEYNIRARELFGEFAKLNSIDGIKPQSGVRYCYH